MDDDGTEAFDFILDYGDRLIAAQEKSIFVPVAAKYSSDPGDVVRRHGISFRRRS